MPDRKFSGKNNGRAFYEDRPGAQRRPLKGAMNTDRYDGPRVSSRPSKPVPAAVHDDDRPHYGHRDTEYKPRFDRRDDNFRPHNDHRRDDMPPKRFDRDVAPKRFDRDMPPKQRFDRDMPPKPRFDREMPPKPRFDRDMPPKPHFDNDEMPPRPFIEGEAPEMAENILAGRNPIREAIKSGRPVEKLLVAEGELTGSAREIVAWALEAGIIVQHVDRKRLDAIYPNHQGMLAYIAAAEYGTVEDMLAKAEEKGEDPFLIICDGITDPHNLGAIIRTAECAGAHGVIIPERRSAGLNPACVKASAGAVEYVPVAKVVNLTRTIEELKEKGIWVIGTAMEGEKASAKLLHGPIALVIGSEGEGISQLVRKNCDALVRLPMWGKIESLNASVAAGIMMYDVARTRGEKDAE